MRSLLTMRSAVALRSASAIPLALAAALLPAAARAGSGACSAIAGVYGEAPTSAERAGLLRLVHAVARQEGIDPLALEAIGMVETGLRPAVGADCELGPFQVMQFWAPIFQLASPAHLWDLRVNAIAAARVYKASLARWRPRFAALGRNPALRRAGWRRGALDRATFAAVAYHWGRAPAALASSDPRRVAVPASAARYAVDFKRELDRARARARE